MIKLKLLEKSRDFWFLVATSFFFFLLRLPSLFEPYWYGDEGIYQALGLGIRAGRTLYVGVFDNKPPFLYYLYGIFNSDQFLLRLASLIFGLLSIYVFYAIAKKISQNRKAVFISTFLYSLFFGLPLIEGNIANSENFMLLFNLVSAFLILNAAEKKDNAKILFWAGILISFSFLFKIVALFDFAAFFVFLFFYLDSNLKNFIKRIFPYVLGFVVPIAIVAAYFFTADAFSYFLKATFLNNVGYVGYGNKFIIPQGLLYLKIVILGISVLFLYWKKNNIDKKNVFVVLWVLFSLFNSLFSQRPYTHYVLVMLPSFFLLTVFVFSKARNYVLNSALLLITLFILLTNFAYYVKTIFYYQNFLSFLVGTKSAFDYQNWFDRNTPNDYSMAAFLNANANKDDNLFIWGNNAQLYKMTDKLSPGRYTVAYHITGYKDGLENTKEGLERANPKFIVVMKNVGPYPFSLANYRERITIGGNTIYERIY